MTLMLARRGAVAASRASTSTATVLSLPGTDGNYATTPDSVAVSITGDIDIRAKVTPADWTPASSTILVTKWPSSGNRSYRLLLNSTGLLLSVTTNGTTLLSSTAFATGFTDGQPGWVRATRVASTGAWVQYTSTDGSSWSTLNNGTMTSGNIFDTTEPLAIGGQSNNGTSPLNGLVHYAEVRNGIAGTVIAKYDPSAVVILGTRNPTTLVASTGETWTMNGSAWDWASV